jgi:predicted DCC family thiol-disulfide oxidoreductase YuxK
MSELCRAWEERAARAEALGLRVCRLRIGLVLGREGGAAKPLALASRFGLGTVMGSGRQWVSWIHLADLVRLIAFALDRNDLAGPINAVAPEAARQAEFARSLAHAFGRKVRLAVPARALQLGLGELSLLFLGSQRVRPEAALHAGFLYRFPALGPAFADLYGRAADTPLKNTHIAVYMNEACPACRIEMAHYEALSRAADRPVEFERIGTSTAGLPEFGLSATDLRRRLYLRDRNGALHSGIDALAALWAELPRYRRAAAALRSPVLRWLGDLVYEGLCVPILARWNRRRGPKAPLLSR